MSSSALFAGSTLQRVAGLKSVSGPVLQTLERLADGIGSDSTTRQSLSRLRSGARVVVAGQQPGVCGGPLLTVLKTIEAIKVAVNLTQCGVDTVPVFWNATTDHDLDEMNRLFLPSADGLSADRFRFAGWSRGPAASACFLGESQIADLNTWLSDHNAALRAAEQPVVGESLARWQSRLINNWFSGTGLVVLEADAMMPHDYSLKERVLRSNAELLEALRRGQAAHPDREPALNGSIGSFLFEQGPPRRRINAGENSIDTEGWLEKYGSNISGDVVGRVLSQQAILPVAFQITGPSERLYIEEMTELFDVVNVPRLHTMPRPSCCLLSASLTESLEEIGVGPESTLIPKRWPKMKSRRASRRSATAEELQDVANARKATRPERQMRKRLAEWITPRGRPQERVFSLVAFGGDRPRLVQDLLSRELPTHERTVVVLQ